MNFTFFTIFMGMNLVLAFYLLRCIKSSHPFAIPITHFIGCVLTAGLSYGLIFISPYEALTMVLYSFYFISFDWILFFLIRMCYALTNLQNNRLFFVIQWNFVALCIFDTLTYLVNPVTEHIFSISYATLWDGTIPTITENSPMYFHYCICYAMFLYILTILVFRLEQSSQVYHIKYLWLIIFLSILGCAQAINQIYNCPIRFQVLLDIMYSILIYYLCLSHIPHAVLEQFFQLYIDRTNDGMLFIDAEDRCINANHKILHMLSLEDGTSPEHARILLEKQLKEHGINPETATDENFVTNQDGKRRFIHFEHLPFTDESNRHVGHAYILHDNTDQMRDLVRERYEATHDKLTGMFNCNCFYKQVQQRIERGLSEPHILLCTDIDNFKYFNDIYGTRTGDKVLKELGDELRHYAPPEAVYGRLTSDSFGLFLPKRYQRDATSKSFNRTYTDSNGEHEFSLIMRIGIYEVTDPTMPISTMCDRAFLAINTIRGNAMRTIAVYKEDLRSDLIHQQRISQTLQQSLEAENFLLYLQPQFTRDGTLHGAEVLIRWNHPEFGFLTPNRFVPYFEKSGQIVSLDQYVWEHACRLLRRWQDKNINISLSVNISPVDFDHINICDYFVALVRKYGISPKKLHLEITESAILNNNIDKRAFLDRLHRNGFLIEMDDFGSGYSSLNMLKDLDVDILKLDMRFLSDSEYPDRSMKILTSVIALSKALDMPALAEGVETPAQLELLNSIDCDLFQGYYFSKPIPITDFEEMYLAACMGS